MKFSEYVSQSRIDEGILDTITSKIKKWFNFGNKKQDPKVLGQACGDAIHGYLNSYLKRNAVIVLEYLFDFSVWVAKESEDILKIAKKYGMTFEKLGVDIKVPSGIQKEVDEFAQDISPETLKRFEDKVSIKLSSLSAEEREGLENLDLESVNYTVSYKFEKPNSNPEELEKIAKEMDKEVISIRQGGGHFDSRKTDSGMIIPNSNRITRFRKNYAIGVQSFIFTITVSS